jgi:LysR family hydrogen peroxide-inducible transcriptional activator
MTIVQLEYFLAVATCGNFSAAAKHCFVTTSSLSTQISNLERELGVILLDRNKKPIIPTETGQVFLAQTIEVIATFYKAKEKVNEIKGKLSGKLRLGVIPTISPYLMPEFIPRFIKKCPDIKLYVYDMYTADIIDALARAEIDMAILSGGQSDVKIEEIYLFDDKFYMYVSPNNELYGRKEILVENVDAKQLLILSEGNCLRNQSLKLCKARKEVDPPFDFMRCSLETLMYTAERISGTTIIPGMAIRHIPKEKRNQVIPFGRSGAKRKITMAVSPTYIKESLVNIVKETIIEVNKEEFAYAEFHLL